MSSSIKTFEHIPCKLFIWENLVTQEFCSSLPSQTEAKKIPILFHDFLIKLCSFSGANHHLRPSKTHLEFFIFFKLGFPPCKIEQPLRSMEVQEKEVQQDWSIQEIYLEKASNQLCFFKACSLSHWLKTFFVVKTTLSTRYMSHNSRNSFIFSTFTNSLREQLGRNRE